MKNSPRGKLRLPNGFGRRVARPLTELKYCDKRPLLAKYKSEPFIHKKQLNKQLSPLPVVNVLILY